MRFKQHSCPWFKVVLAIVGILLYLLIQYQLEIRILRSPPIKHTTREISSASLQSHASLANKISHEKSFADLSLNGGFCPETSCTIGHTSIHEAFRVAPDAPESVQSNLANKFITVPVDSYGTNTFQMLLRDPNVDKFISGHLATGREHDPSVHSLVVRSLQRNNNKLRREYEDNQSIFIDIGANIGYFTATALAVGATTISFEPFYENSGVLMSTISKNKGWADRATLYMNPLGYESNIVTMEPTNSEINLSNMHITGSRCAPMEYGDKAKKQQRYGIDYMESVSLDQVMTTYHREVSRVQLMKVDVETYEIQVFNGAMYTLCNTIVERIVVEVEYLKPFHKLDIPCNFNKMRDTLVLMGYDILDLKEEQGLTSVELKDMPPDIVFRLKDMTQAPARRLGGGDYDSNPCKMFDI